jgi:hypothetical protein
MNPLSNNKVNEDGDKLSMDNPIITTTIQPPSKNQLLFDNNNINKRHKIIHEVNKNNVTDNSNTNPLVIIEQIFMLNHHG